MTEPQLPVVVASHRGPVRFADEDGRRVAMRGAGGLVSALMGLPGLVEDLVWVCAAASDADRHVAQEHGGHAVRVRLSEPPTMADDPAADVAASSADLRLVELDPVQHDRFYGIVANPVLWFVQHGLYGLGASPELTRREHVAFEEGYIPVNEAFADAISAEVQARGGRALVFLHDYHLYLVGALVREACPDAVLSHFVHIPWPGPDAWRVLPPPWRDRLLRGMLGCDVVAFHTEGFARNFLLCAQELLGIPVDLRTMSVEVGDRTVHVRHYPISVDVKALERLAASDVVARYAKALEEDLLSGDRQLVLRVDRTDPSKNIVRGFRAFERLLEQHPELVGRVTFLAILQPSRQDVPEYASYLAEIGAAVARINAKYPQVGHQPVDLRLQEDLAMAVAAYSICDVLVVNAVADGMNLVAKETVVVNRRDGVLALSEATGAHAELGAFAVTLFPVDIDQQAEAFYEALTMPLADRRARLEAARSVVRANDVAKWLAMQLADLRHEAEVVET